MRSSHSPDLSKQAESSLHETYGKLNLCWKNHGGPVNAPHISIKTRKKSDDIKRHDAEKLHERTPCAVNLKERHIYSQLHILS